MFRRSFGHVLFGLTLGAMAVLCFSLWHVLDVPVRAFVIEGDLTRKEQNEIQRILSAQPFTGVLSTDLTAVAEHLEQLPWCRDVSIRRNWPDKLVVAMRRAKPVARWGEDQYVSAKGELLSLPDDYAGLPQFKVAVSNPRQVMEVYRLLDQIAARENLTIQQLHQNDQGEWTIRLSRGPRILLGAERLNERMHRFLLVYRRVLTERRAEYVDARYANGVAVRFATVAAPRSEHDKMLVAQNLKLTYAKGKR